MPPIARSVYTCALTFLLTLIPSFGIAATIAVNAGGNLQAAINAAQPGDTIVLQAGATFVGNFDLPDKGSSTAVITIRSSAADASLPAPGVRITPSYASLLPKIKSPNGGAAMRTVGPAHHWRLLFLEFGPTVGGINDLLQLGDGSPQQNALWQVAHDLVVDRVYFHGDPAAGQKRGIALNSASTQILNSYFADFKKSDAEAQAICGWNGPGPYLIENNYLEAAGENVMFGGADPSIPQLVPTGITFRRNYVTKNVAWRNSGWWVFNLFELKMGRDVVIEGNIFENHWVMAQNYAIVFTPRNQNGTAPWVQVENVLFQHNIVRHVASAFNILGYDTNAPSQQTRGITIRNNLLYDVNASAWNGAGRFAIIGNGPRDITIEHNTIDHTHIAVLLYGGTATAPQQIPGFRFADNLLRDNGGAIIGDNFGAGTAALNAYTPGAPFAGNSIGGGNASTYPAGNFYPPLAQWLAGFVNPSAADFHLTSTSAARNAATDGTDIGVNFALLDAALNGTAAPPPAPPPTPPPTGPTPYNSSPIAIPGTIQAENFDEGGEGVAYHDDSAGNNGGQYRSTAVDVEGAGDTGGGYNVGWMAAGEWLLYTVNVQSAGSYTLEARVASNGGGGTFHVEAAGVNLTGPVTIPNTGGWQAWQTISKNVTLQSGLQTIRLVLDTTGASGAVGNVNYLRLAAASSTPPPPPSSTNLALGKTVAASSLESGSYAAPNAVDGNGGTRWSSAFTDIEWFSVDLGSSATIDRVVLRWEAAYGRAYQIQVSSDAQSWSTVFSTTSGDGGVDDVGTAAVGRYVRMIGSARGTPWGYSLFEMEVYGASGAPLPSPPSGTAQPVVWTNTVRTSVTGTALVKTGGCDGCPDAGATSQQTIGADGFVEFSPGTSNGIRFVGLAATNPDTGYVMPYSFRLSSGVAEVREQGVYRADAIASATDVLRIEVSAGVVRYYKNGQLLFTSGVKATTPLFVDTSFLSAGATIANAMIK